MYIFVELNSKEFSFYFEEIIEFCDAFLRKLIQVSTTINSILIRTPCVSAMARNLTIREISASKEIEKGLMMSNGNARHSQRRVSRRSKRPSTS